MIIYFPSQKENFPPVLKVVSPVSGDPLYQLKSPGHIAKLQLARAAAAQQAHRYSMGANPAASNESKAVQAVSRRRAAAEWVESLTGIALPTASDAALRGALRDGLLLCKILNILRPGILPKVPPPCPLIAAMTHGVQHIAPPHEPELRTLSLSNSTLHYRCGSCQRSAM